MRDFSAVPLPAKPLGGRAAGREKLRLMRHKPGPDRGSELLAAVSVIALFVVCGAVYFCSALLSSDRFHDGVYVNGIPLGGITAKEAADRFAGLKAKTPASLKVMAGDKTWTVQASDVDAHVNVDDTLARAWTQGREGSAFERLGAILKLRMQPQHFDTAIVFDSAKLKGLAEKIASEASVPERDAALQFLPQTQNVFTITEGSNGAVVDAPGLFTLLSEKLTGGGSEVAVQSSTVKPRVTSAMLQFQTQLLASFTTALTNDSVRNNNIKLAATAVSGTVLYPGDEFSFNALTGERTKAQGYVDAPAILSGKLVDAPGGGVCQVATTVYNAALLAGLDISERHHHTWKMSYVDAGLDATVDWASEKDLRFKNNTNTPVYLVCRVDDDSLRVTANFYGVPGDDMISISTEVLQKTMPGEPLKTNNPNASMGTNTVISDPIFGYHVKVYRVYTATDGSTRRDLVSEDIYDAVREQIEIGTKPPKHRMK